MGILSLQNISKTFAGQPILNGVSFQMHSDDKAGLIGPNGCGKSTLLKIIKGDIEADSGNVHISSGATLGYLPQEPRPPGEGTLRSLLEKPLQPLLDIKKEISRLEQEISSKSNSGENNKEIDNLLRRYGELREDFSQRGGYEIESRIKAVSRGVGFAPDELNKNILYFSGGEITRARLASLLLQEPEFLLLDEPTNFLDINGLEWLEKYLKDWKGSLLIVSHDRFFLDRVVNRILNLQNGKIKYYPGNYSSFVRQKEQEDISLQRQYQKQQEYIKKEQKLIREADGHERSQRQARSREKRLEKLETIEPPSSGNSRPGIEFSLNRSSGKIVISLEDISKFYGTFTLFEGVTLEILRGERVALVGPNGSGKSTLLKLIAGEETPTGGRIKTGSFVNISYFSQEQDELHPEYSVLEEIAEAGKPDFRQARQHLGGYLFQGDDVFKKVGSLSSGEKSRLALARLALYNTNCLLMDEPTSHLDLPALENMEEALNNFPGTLIIVSHDRYFLNRLTNRVIEIGSGQIQSFYGSYTEYLEQKKEADNNTRQNQDKESDLKKQEHQRRRRAIKEKQRRQKKLQQLQEQLENSIAGAEAEVTSLEEKLSSPDYYGDYQKLLELHQQLQEARSSLSSYLEQWEQVSVELENISSELSSEF